LANATVNPNAVTITPQNNILWIILKNSPLLEKERGWG